MGVNAYIGHDDPLEEYHMERMDNDEDYYREFGEADQQESLSPAHDALNRMRRAEKRETGCHLTADMIQSLALTSVGDIWRQDDPRKSMHD